MKTDRAIVLASGGNDSTTCWYLAKETWPEVEAVYFNYGQKQMHEELRAVTRISKLTETPYRIITLPFVADLFKSSLLEGGGEVPDGQGDREPTCVPFRNAIMLSIAVGYAESVGARSVVIGNNADSAYPDAMPPFTEAMARAAQLGTYTSVSIFTPFDQLTQAGIIVAGARAGVPYELTYSCYKGRIRHCGKCCTCVGRAAAFEKAGVPDPTRYEEGV